MTLSPRETEILRLVAAGLTNREIASSLRVSERTVKWHLANVFRKLQASNRSQALVAAIRSKDLKLEE